ncbi:hypothetical protein DXG01_004067 [Tephrocybe rancida]|nr:hypothetical protein DXG01_004067 [Tephrocybe rancida]
MSGATLFGVTWSDTTYQPSVGPVSIEIPFKGTAIYVFFTLFNAPPLPLGLITAETTCSFALEDNPKVQHSLRHVPSKSRHPEINALVFTRTDLANTHHNLKISVPGNIKRPIYVNFDYAIVTTEDDPPSPLPVPVGTSAQAGINPPTSPTIVIPGSPSSTTTTDSKPSVSDNLSDTTNVGAIVGGVIAGVAVLLLLVLAFLCRRWRSSRRATGRYLDGRWRLAPSVGASSTMGGDRDQPGSEGDFHPSRFATYPGESGNTLPVYTQRPIPAVNDSELAAKYAGDWGYSNAQQEQHKLPESENYEREIEMMRLREQMQSMKDHIEDMRLRTEK